VKLKMFAGWSRAVVLVAMAAFLGNAHCLGNCASAACNSPSSTSKGCHHHKKPAGDLARCSHQHSEFVGPEASLAKITLAKTIEIAPVLSVNANVVSTENSVLLPPDTGPPPRAGSGSSISVLRI
jgi:hypothetical protein